jgi:hypothetical protein
MASQFKSRVQFRLALLLSQDVSDVGRPASTYAETRRKLQILCQETRFAIYQIVKTSPRKLTKIEIGRVLELSDEKVANNLYPLLNEGIVLRVVQQDGQTVFEVNPEFAEAARTVF